MSEAQACPDFDPPSGLAPDSTWFQRVADSSGLVFFMLRIRPDVAFEFVNGGMRTQLVGRRPDTTNTDAAEIFAALHPDSVPAMETMLAMRPGSSMEVELKWRHVSGHPVFSRGWVHARARADASVVLEGALQDVTALHEVETELRRSEERHRLLAENAWDVVWTMALDGTITYVSPAVQRVRGFTQREAMAHAIEQIHPPASAASVAEYFRGLFDAVASGQPPPSFQGELEYYRKDGSIMTGELQVIPHVDADGHVVEILGVTRDISDRKEIEAELTRLAVTDPVTGLSNRRHTAELLTAELLQAGRHRRPMSLLMADIDDFKAINDAHGHQAGDRVLAEVARRIRGQVRATDVASRWGGEEFVILLRYCGLTDAVAAAEKLRRQISDQPITGLGPVTVSIGVAELARDDDVTTWLGRADEALYAAKRSGRNTVVGL